MPDVPTCRHSTGAERYTKCFDEIHKAVRKVNPTIFFAGPEGTGYTDYLIDVRPPSLRCV